MTLTEIEKRFYEAFDIKVIGCYKGPKDYCTYDNDKYNKCKAQGLKYTLQKGF